MLIASLLLVLLSLSTGIVSALLSLDYISGSKEINGYRAENDTITIGLSSTSNVSVLDVTDAKCINTNLWNYVCTFKDIKLVSIASYKLTNLENDPTITANIKVDNSIGKISYNILHSNNIVSINYSILDLGFNGNMACSGIKSITIFDSKTRLNTIDISDTTETCFYSGLGNISITGSGTKSISLEIIDNVGNKQVTPAENITIDLSKPKVNNGLMIKYSGTTDEIGTISSSASFFVDLYFNIEEESLKTITANLANLNINPAIQQAYANYNVPLSSCEINVSSSGIKSYNCIISGIQLRLADSSIKINITAVDSYDNSGSAILSKSLTIDNVEPIAEIKTDKCSTAGLCYIKNGEANNVIITLNKNNFNNKFVFFDLPGSVYTTNRVQNCSKNICKSTVSLTCNSGSQVPISITEFFGYESQDDAGNLIAPFTAHLYCDNTAPVINDIMVTADASSKILEFVEASTITISANVTEVESDELTAFVYLDKIKNSTEKGACTKISEYGFSCVWTINNIGVGAYTANIAFNISDIAGNVGFKEYAVKVLGKKSNNDTPDNLDIQLMKVTPREINRVVLDMATSAKTPLPYYVYATYKLNVIKGIDVEALYQQLSISDCVYHGTYDGKPSLTSASDVFSEIKLSEPYAKVGEIGRIDFKFKDGLSELINTINDEFVVSCNISVMEKENNKIYIKPQILQLDMRFKLINSKLCKNTEKDCTPGAVFGAKITDMESKWIVKSKLMSTVNNLIPKLQAACKINDYLNMGTAVTSAASVALDLVQLPELAVGPMKLNVQLSRVQSCLMGSSGVSASVSATSTDGSVNGFINAFSGKMTKEQQDALHSQCQGLLGKMCSALTCDVAKEFEDNKVTWFGDGTAGESKIPDYFAKDSTFTSEIGNQLDRNLNVPDVGNSIIMAVSTGCYPAIYYNVNKVRQIDCNYLYCLKMASYSGTDISSCEKAKYAQECSLVVGEIFELPGAVQIKNLMNNAADLVRTAFPLAIASGLKRTLCPEYLDFDSGSLADYGTLKNSKAFQGSDPATQKRMIYGCQVPLQIARFADSTTRSKQSGTFTYPIVPDMCKYATCIGEENCAYTPDFLDTISKMQLSELKNTANTNTNTISYNQNVNVAQINQNVKSLNDLNKLLNVKKTMKSDSPLISSVNKQIDAKIKTLKEQKVLQDSDIGYLDKNTITDKINFYQSQKRLFVECLNAARTDCEQRYLVSGSTNILSGGIDGTALSVSDEEYNKLSSVQERMHIDDTKITAAVKVTALTTKIDDLEKQKNILIKNNQDIASLTKQLDELTASRNELLQGLGITSSNALSNSNVDYNLEIERITKEIIEIDKENIANLERLESALVDASLEDVEKYNAEYSRLTNELNLKEKALQDEKNELTKKQEAIDASKTNVVDTNAEIISKAEAIKEEAIKHDNINKLASNSQRIGNTIFMGLQYANANHLIDFMFTDYWLEKLFGGKNLADFLDFDKHKESLCNPNNPVSLGSSSEGSVISCSDGNCLPVLTYAAERTELVYPNGTNYNLYTVVYYISSGDSRGRDVNYNVYFKNSQITQEGYKDNPELQPFEVKYEKKVFQTAVIYDKMCVEFNIPFPIDNAISNKKEYCRDITTKIFDTGSPVFPENATNIILYTDKYDIYNNPINTGTDTTDAVGVLD
jgi:hypothetical protein